jgi:TolB protein
MTSRIGWLAGALALVAAAGGAVAPAVAHATRAAAEPLSPCNDGNTQTFQLESTIAFSSTRDHPTGVPVADAAEIYLMKPDGTSLRRLTDNQSGDGFAALSPDGKRIVFDSNRNRAAGEPLNTSDLFVMNADGSEQTFLTRGSSATWSPDCKQIAFHASASGTGTPIRTDPGSATSDSDIFVVNVDDLLAGTAAPVNITNSEHLIDDDPDWSPDGQNIVYTAHPVTDDPQFSNLAEIYVRTPGGTGPPTQLTDNTEEERGPAWSPDGTRIVYACRIGGGTADFEICVINADGSGARQLTDNAVADLTPTFAPDGQQIVFHRINPPAAGGAQLWLMNAEGSSQRQLTLPPGINLLAHWGQLRVKA